MSDRITIPVYYSGSMGRRNHIDSDDGFDMRSMNEEQLNEVDRLGGIHCSDDIREKGWMFPPDFRTGR